MDVWTIGTSSAVPTRERGLPCNMVNFEGERLLFDCGEGAQRRIMMDKLGLMKISRVFITHWHADHFSGLLGLIQTLEMEGREHPLYIYGPPRTEEFTERLLDLGYFNRSYDIFAEDLVEGDAIVGEGYEVRPFEVDHSVNAFGYVFQEEDSVKANKQKMEELGLGSSPKIGKLKAGEAVEWNGETIEPEQVVERVPGRKVVYTGDTAKSNNTVKHAEGADILIHESTVTEELIDERRYHSSAKQAAEVAKQAGVDKLVLIHFSRRYRGGKEQELLDEAKEVFENTVLGEDGKHFEVNPHRPES